MKKSKRLLLASSLIIMVLGAGCIIKMDTIQQITTKMDQEVQAYNYAPDNILDNVYVNNGQMILPFIFQSSEQNIATAYVKDEFTRAGKTIKSISTEEIVTGTQIVANDGTYVVVIYGDVNADGYVDVFDAQKIIKHYVFAGNDTITGIHSIAANVDNMDNEIDVFDAQRIIKFYVGLTNKLVTNEPIADKERDTEKPVITLKGANPQIINVGSNYVELGATVTDNVDKNLIPVINTSNVNTKKVGSYTVTYNATDKAGNKANQVTRTVSVIDTVKPVITLDNTNVYSMEVGKTKPTFKATATDNYDTNVTVVITDDINVNVVGSYTVTFKAKDSSNNEVILTKQFEVKDTTKPVITLDNTNVYSMEVGKTKPTFKATATDNYDTDVAVVITDDIDVNIVGTYTITFKAKDSHNNEMVITKEFKVTPKDITSIEITKNKTTGYANEGISIGTVKSGQNQKDIVKEDLKIYVTDNIGVAVDSSLYTVTKEYGPGNITAEGVIVTVTMKNTGNYKITPYLGTSITDLNVIKIDTPVEIEVTNNPTVNSIEIDAIADGEVRLNKQVDKNIIFKNKYNQIVEVEANRIRYTEEAGITVTLLDKDGTPIDETRPNEIVKAIRFKTTLETAEVRSANIIADGITKVVNMNIGSKSTPSQVIINSGIDLYGKMPTNIPDNVKEGDYGEIYTILPIQIKDQYGEEVKLYGNLSMGTSTGNKLEVIDSVYNPNDAYDTPRIMVQMYQLVGGQYVPAPTIDVAEYIGIALADELSIEEMGGQQVLFKIGGTKVAEITVTIPVFPLSSMQFEQDTLTGYANESMQVGVVKAGDNQEAITKEQLKFYITDENGVAITDTSKITVTGEYFPGNIIEDGIIITAKPKVSGIYKITPYVGTSINDADVVKLETPITVTVTKKPTVTSVEVKAITDNEVTANKVVNKTITFKNQYNEIINVEANRITVTAETGVTATLLDKDGNIITADRPTEEVTGIRIETTLETEVTKTITLSVDGVNKVLSIKIGGKGILTSVDIASDIELFETAPSATSEITKIENIDGEDVVYTLKSIALKDQYGVAIKLYGDLSVGTLGNNKLEIKDSLTPLGDPLPYTDIKMYKKVGSNYVEATSTDEAEYIGVALAVGTLTSDVSGADIIISYQGTELIRIGIK